MGREIPRGNKVPYPQVIRDVVEQAVLAESLGIDAFGHRANITATISPSPPQKSS